MREAHYKDLHTLGSRSRPERESQPIMVLPLPHQHWWILQIYRLLFDLPLLQGCTVKSPLPTMQAFLHRLQRQRRMSSCGWLLASRSSGTSARNPPPEVGESVLWRGVKTGKHGNPSTKCEYFNGEVRHMQVEEDGELYLYID